MHQGPNCLHTAYITWLVEVSTKNGRTNKNRFRFKRSVVKISRIWESICNISAPNFLNVKIGVTYSSLCVSKGYYLLIYVVSIADNC
jgi:hypothetical protein